MKKTLVLIAGLLMAMASEAVVKLPQMFQSGMVLQRLQPLPVWGTADAGETVTVTFRGKSFTTTADDKGKWQVTLPKQKHGGPFVMTVNDVTIDNVMVGDVWMCSGQSNIDIHIERVYPQYSDDIDKYTNDNIRMLQVATRFTTDTQDDILPAQWKPVNKENAWKFSAMGYFLAQRMYEKTKIPQGIIQCSLGGSPIQAWISLDSIKGFSTEYYNKYMLYTDKAYVEAQSKANSIAGEVWQAKMNQTDPGYNVFEKADYDDSGWEKHNQYDNNAWARHNGRPIIGSMWLRQHVYVDAAHAGKPATMFMGTLHDMDYTYVNGKQVGVTYYQYPPRRYAIPAGLLHEGDNVIAVRIICKGGMANFYKDKPHEIIFGKETGLAPISLSLDWLTHKGSLIMEGPLGGKIDTQNQASMLYNGMLRPLAPYAMKGIVWYQGESNTGRPNEYGAMLKMLMGNWRTLWNRDDMPFSIVQLANHMEATQYPTESGWATLREQQRLAVAGDAHSNLAVAIDLGEASDIHPLRKRELAERCALGLDNLTENAKNALSPLPVKAYLQGGNVVVEMDQTLETCGCVCEMEVKMGDGKFVNVSAEAPAKASGKIIVIPVGDKPVSCVRYAWKNNPEKANLRNPAGLPASPFQMEVTNP